MSARHMKGSWWVDFRFEGERFRLKSPVDTKRGAEEYERRVRQQVLDGTFVRKERDAKKEEEVVPTVAEFAKEFVSGYARANNKPSEVAAKESAFKHHLVPELGSLRLDEVDLRSIERFKAKKLADGLKPKTVNNLLAILGKMLSIAVEWGVITNAPRLKWLKVPDPEFDFLTFEEADRLMNALADTRDVEWRAMIIVALKAGLRLGELRGLRWDDVDLVSGRIVVRQAVARNVVGTPKSGRSRDLPLTGTARLALKSIRHLRGELVFCNAEGKLWTADEAKWALRRACKRAGLRRIGWHVLRHTFASHLAMRGVPLKAIQELLGHSTIEMTMRYAHLAATVKRDAVDQLDQPAPAAGHQMGTSGHPADRGVA